MLLGVVRLIVNHRPFPPSQAHQKQGPFPPPALPGFIGRTALSDSQTGRRPFWRRSEARPSTSPEPPPLTQIAFPTCRAHYPGGPVQVLVGCRVARSRAGCFPVRTAFPVSQAGRRPHLPFRCLLKLPTRYGLPVCSPPLRVLSPEAPPYP